MDEKAVKLIDMVLVNEGGYCNVDGDSGAETYRGISRISNPKWKGWKIVDSYKPIKYNKVIDDDSLDEAVCQFYYDNYYVKVGAHLIDEMLLSAHLFDHGVNAGVKTSAMMLQRSINTVCGSKLKIDGIVGKQTAYYANGEKSDEITQEFIRRRKQHYNDIVKKKPSQKKFLKGWLNRVNNVTKKCGSSNVLLTGLGGNSVFSTVLEFIWKLIEVFVNRK